MGSFQKRHKMVVQQAASLATAVLVVGCDPAQKPKGSADHKQAHSEAVKVEKNAPPEKRVLAVVVEQLGLKVEPKSTDRFIEDLGADSLDFVELIMSFEEEFNIQIPDEEAVKLKTLGDVTAFVSKAVTKAEVK